MFGGVLKNLMSSGADDVARVATKKAATAVSDDALNAAKQYMGKGRDHMSLIADERTGKTLGESIENLRQNKWSEQDITKFTDAILERNGLKQAAPKPAPGAITDMNPTGGVLVDYDPAARMTAPLADNIKTLADTAKMQPDDLVDIYRGLPDNVDPAINPGDFITTNPELAKSYGGNVHKMQARYRDILDDMNEPLGEEYIFRPQQQEVFSPRFKRQTGNPDVDARISEVVDMSPDEYLQKAFEATDGRLGGNYDSWLASNAVDPATTKSYAEAMRKGDEFPMAYIDNAFGSQDGRNRALAVKMAGGKSMPVGVVPEMTTEQATKYYTDLLNNSTSNYSRMVYQRKLDGLSKK